MRGRVSVTPQTRVSMVRADIATVMYPTAILFAFGLLVKDYVKREFLGAPVNALWKHVLVPTAGIGFAAFLYADATTETAWPMIASAAAVWLLFANSVNYVAQVLGRERWLLRQSVIPPWLLIAAAAVVPVALFGVHLLLIRLAIRTASFSGDGISVEILVGGCIAAAFGLGAGMLAARLTRFRPSFAATLPKLLLISLVLTPVLYRRSALDGLKDAWCMANPLCVATELGRAGFSLQPELLPPHAKTVACAISAVILCWGLVTLNVSPSFADEHA
jgi:ABC-type polysaccharide/polyol phosphate export permease